MIYGHWDRFEPRPPEHEITSDLLDFSLWISDIVSGLDVKIVDKLTHLPRAKEQLQFPEGDVKRTPDERFKNLPDFPYDPQYVDLENLRMAYVEHGTGDPILLLHGEPTWGYLYRRMIPPLAGKGRTITPDLIGFGRSDKPVPDNAYSYKAHVRWLRQFVVSLDLNRITLICQDWGGLIGLRLLAEIPDRFQRLVAMNTAIPDGSPISEGFNRWRNFSQQPTELNLSGLMNQATQRDLTQEELDAYGAPFPSREYQTGALVFPRLVPIRRDHPGAYDNRQAIEVLKTLDLPVFLPFGEADRVLGEQEPVLRSLFKNVAPKLIIKNAGHFIQDDAGEEVAEHILKWMAEN
ncbi:MAG: alpha/beta fold hydrolase [Deltaproteobacteria bacterium]|nr:alpha/beta fold hydrolase [Deltaproteobacteria bacterium]MBW1813074.1 alpha/beta fold hydrolase [Deltaproteobacteria bacterium]MBW2181093.1 alpha/beta fold hydrolase [Deltaproteobacteria bacterium]MBW2363950.1 alpha/beta fold hydrolase [Deltaproteobacteria bacterium]